MKNGAFWLAMAVIAAMALLMRDIKEERDHFCKYEKQLNCEKVCETTCNSHRNNKPLDCK